jgi:pimeloyl-ACP methyl ester carboxylesterase
MASLQSQNMGGTAGSPAASGVNMNFVGNPDTVFRQIKQYHDECGVGIVDFFFQGPTMEHEAVMKSLGLDTYALIGTSFGGRVALWQAIQAPHQVDPLVLIAPTAVLPEGYMLRSVAPDQIGTLLFAHPENAPARLPVDPATVTKEMALIQRIQGVSRGTELEGKLGDVQTPTLVVFGTEDRVVPPAMGRTYRERMPNCHYVLVYDAGHAVADKRPEALSSTIIDFLDLRETFIVSRRDGRINP